MPAQPNIIFIVSDTLRRDHLGAYGNTRIRTPHLDHFAERSAVFDQHFAASFPTMPARADFLTGTFAFTFLGWEPLPADCRTLPGVLAEAGYRTMGITDTPFFIRAGFNYDIGFDDFLWIRGQGDETRSSERLDVRKSWVSDADRMVARTMHEAEQWLVRNYEEQPFFLYVDTWDPHEPWDAPDHFSRFYKPDFVGPARYPVYGRWEERGVTLEDLENAHAAYCGEVTLVDRWIGRLLETIDLLRLSSNTYVFFTSDHGFYFGEHGFFGKAEIFYGQDIEVSADSEAPDWFVKVGYHTQGWSPLYRDLIHLPLMVRGPSAKPGRRSGLTTAPDIAATILDIGGGETSSMQGKSFRNALDSNGEWGREFAISSWPLYFARGEWSSAIDSQPREIVSYMPITISTSDRSVIFTGPGHPTEMYDIGIDPGEQRNCWSENLREGTTLVRAALELLDRVGTANRYLQPRRDILAIEEALIG